MRVAYFLPKDMTLPRYDGDIRIDMMRAAGLEVTEIPIDYISSSNTNRAVASRTVAEMLTKAAPDVLHLEGGSFSRTPWLIDILGEWKRTLGARVTLWYGDVRGDNLTPLLRKLVSHVDLFLTSNSGLLETYRKAGYAKVAEQHMSVPEHLYGPFGAPEYDVVFVGNNYGRSFPLSPEREKLLKRLDQEFKLLIRGQGWGSFRHAERFKRGHADVGRFYARGKIAIGISHWDVANYYTERFWQGLASGRTHLTRYIPGMERDFVLGHHVETFHTIDDAVDKVKDLLKDDRWRKVGEAGRAIFCEKHTFRHRFERYARLVKELK